MFGLFATNKVRPTAIAIHQLCHMALAARESFGGGLRCFSLHPFLIDHREPKGPYDGHEFRLGQGLDDFRFLVFDKDDFSVQVFGGGDNFAGFGLATLKEKGRYHVYISPPISYPVGQYAKPLLRVFVRDYGARDTSELMAKR